MSVLETLLILFKADTSGIKKGAEEAEKATDGVIKKVDQLDKHSEHAGKSFLNLAQAASGVIAAYVGAGVVLSAFRGNVDYVTQLGNASRALNVNSEDLEAWSYAVKRSGGSAEAFQGSLQGLSEHLGITGQMALKTLPILADTFSRLNTFTALRYGKSLGLDENTILLLQKGRREVEAVIARQKELGVTKQKDIEITRQYNAALEDVAHVYRSLVNEFVTPILPYLTKTFDYLIEHKDAVVGAMAAIGAAAVAMGIKFAIANPELAIFAAAIVGIGTAFEDIKHFVKGDKETALGQIFGARKASTVNDNNAGKLSLFPGLNFSLPKFMLPGSNPGAAVVNHKTVTVGDITINAQEKDAEGIYDIFTKTLKDHLQQANGHNDDGIFI